MHMIPGLYIFKNLLTVQEQEHLLAHISQGEWYYGKDGNQRGVQHYGAAYDYEKHTVAKDADNNPIMFTLPNFIVGLCDKISDHVKNSDQYPEKLKLVHDHQPHDQAFVSEYKKHYGILAHKDSCDYGDIITSVSLGHSTPFIFEKSGRPPVVVMLDAGDLLIMTDQARYEYTHSIPYSKIFRWNSDGPIVGQVKIEGKYEKFKRAKDYCRTSITMRHIKK